MPNIRKTTEHFIQLAQKVHGTKYDYSKSVYTVSANRIIVTCLKHGDFEVIASNHTSGVGCRKCRLEEQSARQKARPAVKPKMTQEQFVARCKSKHGDRYDYSKAVYQSWQGQKACFICKEHGEFWQRPSSHIKGMGCPKCARVAQTQAKMVAAGKRFVDTCRKAAIYGECTYEKVVYVDQDTPVIVTCVKHGDFEITPVQHKAGVGCRQCGIEFKSRQSREQRKREGIESFKSKSKALYGERFTYDLSSYTGWQTSKIKITCNKHQCTFETTPDNHIRHGTCPQCKLEANREAVMGMEKCIALHGDRYDYSQVQYVNCSTKVKIICKKCGQDWMVTPTNHMHSGGSGCPKCSDSRGERAIAAWLKKHEIDFEAEWRPEGGVYGRRFLYDFYAGGVLIEFDGIQHSMPVEIFGGEEAFQKLQENDSLKSQWAEENGIQLVRISHNQIEKIDEILGEAFAAQMAW